jgi:hypothetical protein
VLDYFPDPVPVSASWGPQPSTQANGPATTITLPVTQSRWVWEYHGPENEAPPIKTIVEENMGPFELHLLSVACGKDGQLVKIAEKEDFKNFKFAGSHKAKEKKKKY